MISGVDSDMSGMTGRAGPKFPAAATCNSSAGWSQCDA